MRLKRLAVALIVVIGICSVAVVGSVGAKTCHPSWKCTPSTSSTTTVGATTTTSTSTTTTTLPPPPPVALHIGSCQGGIHTPDGVAFVLDNDLSNAFSIDTCLAFNPNSTSSVYVTPVSHLTLDCRGFDPGTVTFYEVTFSRIENCNFRHDGELGLNLNVGTEVDHNTFTSDGVVRDGDAHEVNAAFDGGGTNDYWHDNTIDGGATCCSVLSPGKDDGINVSWWAAQAAPGAPANGVPCPADAGGSASLCFPSMGLRFEHNTISHVYDCSSELLGSVYNVSYTSNTFISARAGVCGYYFRDYKNVSVSGSVESGTLHPSPYFPDGTCCP